MIKSLKSQHHALAEATGQLDILEHGDGIHAYRLIPFQQKMENHGLYPLTPTGIEIFQVNVGKMCNQVCKHCHVDAGPDRKEIMTRDTMELCLKAIAESPSIHTVDLTGGAPEMNPLFRWFVESISQLGKKIIVRCNLTIILANKKYFDLPEFFKLHGVEVVSSLPFYTADRTDRQRGNGVFKDSIKALQMLNSVGYGQEETGLVLNLVYNPAGAFLPPNQEALQAEYQIELFKRYGIIFNQLFTITNMPISRYLDYLLNSGNYEKYMENLLDAFNPSAAVGVMCRNTISIGWDGYLYDCDFNQMLELKVEPKSTQHVRSFNIQKLMERSIVLNQHCYGCTAGAGSSCGGSVT